MPLLEPRWLYGIKARRGWPLFQHELLEQSRNKKQGTLESLEACREELSVLEEEAGVAKTIQRAYLNEVRRSYFSLRDPELRKLLIARHRKLFQLQLLYSEATIEMAEATAAEANAMVSEANAVDKAPSRREAWLFFGWIPGIILIYISYELLGTWVAVIVTVVTSAVVAALFRRFQKQNINQREKRAWASVAQQRATEDLQHLKNKLPPPPFLFSEDEENTGEVDNSFEAKLREHGYIT
jgi:hypothetical protein